MREKVLTISVAAYNVEDTLARCLDSCADPRVLNDIEVIIVVDGATDGTASIAESYSKQYPETFHVINKENGGYGSTVNESMRCATGKYFRLLDGDDWLDKDGLYELVCFCKHADVSAVYCDKIREYPDYSKRDVLSPAVPTKQVIRDQQVISEFSPAMWNFTFSTKIMHEHPFELPHHCLYTDTLFAAYHLPYIDSVAYLPSPLYHYVLGHSSEQSTSKKSVLSHLEDNYLVWDLVLEFFISHYGNGPATPIMLKRLYTNYKAAYLRTLMQPCSRDNKKRLEALERDLLKKSRYAYDYMSSCRSIRIMRLSRGMAYRFLHIRQTSKL